MTEFPKSQEPFEAPDYGTMLNEAKSEATEFDFHLPAPNLDRAIETAMGDILLINTNADGELRTGRYDAGRSPRHEIRAVSEKEYLTSLRNYLDQCLEVAQAHDPQEISRSRKGYDPIVLTFGKIAEDIADFKENLVFVNNAEFEKATDSMAEKLIADAEAGNLVGVFEYKDRSPRYICVKVLDKVRRILDSPSNYNPDEAAAIRDRIVYSDRAASLVLKLAQKNVVTQEPIKIYAPDDFILSGANMKGAFARLQFAIQESRVDLPDMEMRGLVIAALDRERIDYGESSMEIDSVYNPPRSKNFTSVALAGSWSSTDYGYEGPLQEFADHLDIDHSASRPGAEASNHQIKGRYDRADGVSLTPSGAYFDPQYAEEYQKVIDIFGPKEKSPFE